MVMDLNSFLSMETDVLSGVYQSSMWKVLVSAFVLTEERRAKFSLLNFPSFPPLLLLLYEQ